MTYYDFELSDNQISLIRMSLDTRLTRIEEMIRLFREGGTDNDKWMEEKYCQESLDVAYLMQMFSSNFLPEPKK